MKKLGMVMAMVFVAMSSYGSMQVSWFAGAGFFWDPTYEPLLSPGGSTFAQLVYSPDYIKDNLFDPLYNDAILATYNITEGFNASVFGDFDAGLYTQAFTDGYVYGVVWQDSEVNAGDFYFHSAMLQLEDITGFNPPQVLQMNTDLINGNPMNTPIHLLPGEAGVIPEPSTVLLLGTGGLVVWFGRRKLGRDAGTKVTPKKMQKVDLLHR